MRPLRACLFLSLWIVSACLLGALAESEWYIEALTPQGTASYDFANDVMTATNGVVIKYGAAVLTAERASVSKNSGWVVADGSVRVENEGMIWVGEHISYNFKTRQMTAEQFRTGKAPVYLEAQKLVGDQTNGVYQATNAIVTTDDNGQPFETMRAKSITIVAGKTVTARNATLYLGGIPVFYVPYYSRPLDRRANYWSFTPGYRTI